MQCYIDPLVGRVMDNLKELGIAENTLIIAMADNGPMAPMLRCEVQAHNSTALEINQHLAGVIFHIIHYACRHNGNPRFPADVAPAKSTSRAAGRRAESPSHRGQICTARVPSTAGPRAHCAVHVKNLKICRGSELTRF